MANCQKLFTIFLEKLDIVDSKTEKNEEVKG